MDLVSRASKWLRGHILQAVRNFQQQLTTYEAIPQLAILGIASGLLTGVVILLFRAAIEGPLSWFLEDADGEAFEALGMWWHFCLPIAGAVFIAIALLSFDAPFRRTGVTYVMERLSRHQGYISFRSAVLQFICGVLTVVTGQSAGREGPAVHLGSAASSLLGQRLGLPNNSIRMLVGCGTAAAIAASFNTPIAGVIFAMEVVLLEYTINGFMPVILAAVTAALITQTVYGNDPAFSIPAFELASFWELPYLIAIAAMIGMLSSSFVRLISVVQAKVTLRLVWRLLLAGLLTGALAVFVPQIMGIGYDTVNATIRGEFTFLILIFLSIAKLVVSATTAGLGMPVGLIGPSLFVGATAGGALGVLAQYLMPTLASEPGFYAIMGMAAMMGAFLQAPLAAITAVIEFTQSSTIILPTMLVVICASSVAAHYFRQKSVFLTLLQNQGLSYTAEPLTQALRRVGVGKLMDRNFVRLPQLCTLDEAVTALEPGPAWVVIDGDKAPRAVLPAADLARFTTRLQKFEGELEEDSELATAATADPTTGSHLIALMKIPAQRRDIWPIILQASLEEAWQTLSETGVQALYVQRTTAPMINPILGIITRADIENYYMIKKSK